MLTTYRVQGMSCEGCVRAIVEAIKVAVPGVTSEANFEDGTLTIRGEHSMADVKTAVEDSGFTFEGEKG